MKVAHRWIDPFDEMSDEEFDAHVDELFAARQSTVAVSLRMPPDLLGRVKREAGRAGVPYQRFIKGILEAGVTRLERRGPAPKRSRSSSRAREARRSAQDPQSLDSAQTTRNLQRRSQRLATTARAIRATNISPEPRASSGLLVLLDESPPMTL